MRGLCLISQPFVIALSVRFRVLYNRQSVFNADGVAQTPDSFGAAPKVAELPVTVQIDSTPNNVVE